MVTRNDVIGVTCSILIHLVVVFPLFNKNIPPDQKPVTYNNFRSVELIPIKVTLEINIKDGGRVKNKIDSKICDGKDNTYTGIGIVYRFGSNIITHAPESYPAYIAGIRVGDMVVNDGFDLIKGYADIEVKRGNELLKFHIKADRICYQET